MDWKVLAVSVPLLFVTYQSVSKTLPKDISIYLVNAYASLAGLVVMLLLYFLSPGSKNSTVPHGKWIAVAVIIGVLISLGNFGIIKAFSLGAPQGIFSAFFYTILIIYGVLFGVLIWNEHLKPIQLLGIFLAASGIFITAYFKK
jgi:drug/metabolite transporter (DMT)-like permease